MNFSGGTEYYLNPTNAVRFGFFTNYTNLPNTDSSTVAPYEYIDILGASLGYTSYSSSSSITLGAIYTYRQACIEPNFFGIEVKNQIWKYSNILPEPLIVAR